MVAEDKAALPHRKESPMDFTISDFYRKHEDGMTLIAGAGGMARTITEAGTLDYEMDPTLKEKFFHTNFGPHMLVVTTFMYARDNPFLIMDAIKYLVAKETAGLVIKNVYHIPIHESVIRYADAKNYPIFVLDSQTIYTDRLVYEVIRNSRQMQGIDALTDETRAVLRLDLSEEELRQRVLSMIPSIQEQYYVVYLQFDNLFDETAFAAFYEAYQNSDLYAPENRFICFGSGAFFVFSNESIMSFYADRSLQHIVETLSAGNVPESVGVSEIHLRLAEFRVALNEARFAALAGRTRDSEYVRYEDLGTYRAVLPFARSAEMRHFAEQVLDPLADHDIENNTALLETLTGYVLAGCTFKAAAAVLAQHENTIRYRMDKVSDITGLSYKEHDQLEVLSLAVKIREAGRLLEELEG
jgi:hypothetical protein